MIILITLHKKLEQLSNILFGLVLQILLVGGVYCLWLISENKIYGSLPMPTSAEIPTASPMQSKEESRAVQSENENTNRSAVTVNYKTMQHHRPAKSREIEDMKLTNIGC